MKAPATLLLAFLAAGALALLLFRRARPDGGAASPARAPLPGAREDRSTAYDANAPRAEETRVDPLAAAPAPTDPLAARRGETVPNGRRVQVVDSRGEPVPGALVFVPILIDGGGSVARREEAAALRRANLFAWLVRFTKRYDCDEQGIARIPPPRTYMPVYGRAPGRIGCGYVSTPDGAQEDAVTVPPARIAVFADRDLRVRVVDPSGEPLAGVPITVRGDGGVVLWASGALERTGADGSLLLAHLPALLRESTAFLGRWRRGEETLRAALAIPLAEPVEATIPPSPEGVGPGVDEVVLHAPETGSVAVRLLDADGATDDRSGNVLLAVVDAGLEACLEEPDDPGAQELLEEPVDTAQEMQSRSWTVRPLPLDHGVAHAPHVGLGLELVAMLDDPDQRRPPCIRFHGPARDGPEVAVDLPAGPPVAVLVAHLVGPDGAAVTDRALECELRCGDARSMHGADTDSDGMLRLAIELPDLPDGPWSLGLRVGQRGGVSPGLEATITSDRAPTPGENDLGVVSMSLQPVLVSGRVLFRDHDRPAAGVWVGLMLVSGDPPPGGQAGDARGPLLWTESDAGGRFALYGDADIARGWDSTGRYRLVLSPGGPTVAAQDYVPFEVGERDVEIRLDPTGSMGGRLELAPEMLGRVDLRSLSIAAGPQGMPDEMRGAAWRSGAAFRFVGLSPGPWDLEIGVVGEAMPTRVVEGIRVLPGRMADDPRLDPLFLPDVAHYRIGLEVEEGELPASISIRKRAGGAGGWTGPRLLLQVRRDPDGAFVPLDVGRPGLDVLLWGGSLQKTLLEDVRGDRVVELRNGIPVRVELAGRPFDSVGPDVRLSMRLHSLRQPFGPAYVEVDRDTAAVVLRAPAAGRYLPQLRMELAGSDLLRDVPLAGPMTLIDVPEEEDPPAVVLHVDPERLRALDEEIHRAADRGGR